MLARASSPAQGQREAEALISMAVDDCFRCLKLDAFVRAIQQFA